MTRRRCMKLLMGQCKLTKVCAEEQVRIMHLLTNELRLDTVRGLLRPIQMQLDAFEWINAIHRININDKTGKVELKVSLND